MERFYTDTFSITDQQFENDPTFVGLSILNNYIIKQS